MNCVGIITEYNPFHQGHLYQINEIKRQTGADYIIAVMSGNFVQRGTPAFLDKYARSEMALCHGIDLILELPVCYATASAEFFAFGAVFMLNRLGIIDTLVFGSECGNLSLLSAIADIFNEEPLEYKMILKEELKKGQPFPKARALAALSCLSGNPSLQHITAETLDDVLKSPNNILGIEYLRALKRLDSKITPMTIKREGASYHSEIPSERNASASAIRKEVLSMDAQWKGVLSDLPASTEKIMKKNLFVTYPVTCDDFSTLLYYRLSTVKVPLTSWFDVTDELSNRIQNTLTAGLRYDDFTDALKTKQLTRTRIQRSLLHILLDITEEEMQTFRQQQTVYARILGFNKSSTPLIKEIKNHSDLPLITKPADAKAILTGSEYRMFTHDIEAARLYSQIVFSKYKTQLKDDMTMTPVIISAEKY